MTLRRYGLVFLIAWLWLAPRPAAHAQPTAYYYKLNRIAWSYSRSSPGWAESDIVGYGKVVTLPNPSGEGNMTVTLDLPDFIQTDRGFTSTFSLVAPKCWSPWDFGILGWGSGDNYLDTCVYGETNPVAISLSYDWKALIDTTNNWYYYEVTQTASPHFRDGTTTKVFRQGRPMYPFFRFYLASNGARVLSAWPDYSYSTTPPEPTLDLISLGQKLRLPGTFNPVSTNHVKVQFLRKDEGVAVTAESPIEEIRTNAVVVRVPVDLLGRNDRVPPAATFDSNVTVRIITGLPGTPRTNDLAVRLVRPRLLVHDEVFMPPALPAGAAPAVPTTPRTLLQFLLNNPTNVNDPATVATFMFLGQSADGRTGLRALNTAMGSVAAGPLRLADGVRVFQPVPTGDNFEAVLPFHLPNQGAGDEALQFDVLRNGVHVIVVGADPSSYGPFPSPFQVHLSGNVGLPRKLVNGTPESPRGTRLDTLFNHPAPRPQTLNTTPSSSAETALFKFANPASVSAYAVAVLLPPTSAGFPLGTPIVRAADPPAPLEVTTPTARTPAAIAPAAATVVDFTQVPDPASVIAAPPLAGSVCAAIGEADGQGVALPLAAGGVTVSSLIFDLGSGQEAVDGPGADFSVVALAGTYTVAVANTPYAGPGFDPFVSLPGTFSGATNFDLAGTGLSLARYVRVTAAPAVTLDAVRKLNVLCDRLEPGVGAVTRVPTATILARRAKAPMTALDPFLQLIAPDGALYAENESGFGDDLSVDRSDSAIIQATLGASSFYRFLVKGYDKQPDNQALGSFFTRLETPGKYDPVELQISSRDEAATAAQKQGRISDTRQRDSYLFQAAPGLPVNLVVNGKGAALDPVVELYDPEDFLIGANDNYPGRDKNAALTVTLPAASVAGAALPNPSTYRIVVSAVDRKGDPAEGASVNAFLRLPATGDYELKVFTGQMTNQVPVVAAPRIDSVTPATAAAGATLTLTGANFSPVPANDEVRIGGALAAVISASATELRVMVPSGVAVGPAPLTVSVGGLTSPAASFVVTEHGRVAPPFGLVGWWPGEGTASDLAGTNHGTIQGGVTYTGGKVSQAFSFNGTDGAVAVGAWSPGSAWTIEAWVNPSAIGGGRKGIAGGFSDCHDWGLVLQDGVFAVGIRPLGSCSQSLSSGVSASTNTWYYVVGTCDGTTARIYVDGQLRNSGPVDNGYLGTPAGVRIGGEICCGGDNFSGLIDELTIYNRALSPDDIVAIYAAGGQGKMKEALAGPWIELSPNTLDFGSLLVGQSKELTLTVRNLGGAALTIKTLNLDNGRFAIVSPAVPFTLDPKGTAPVQLRFTAGTAGQETGSLSVGSNDPNRPAASASLAGQGAVADLGGTLTGTLSRSNSPYRVTSELYVPSDQTLTLEPGVTLQFQNPGVGLTVDGTLIARGTVDRPILFTSDKAVKQPGQWRSIIFRDSSVDTNTVMEYCQVEYGAASGAADEIIRLDYASPTISHCTIRGSRANGVAFLHSEARVENCQFADNAGFAMAMRIDAFARLKNNTAVGNGQNAIAIYDSWPGRSGTWVKDNLPYTLVNYVGINAGQTLTVEPGVIVQFQNPDTHLIIDGSLRAVGTVDQPIVFTSDEVAKGPGQWGALIFRASSLETNTLLDNCVVEYGGYAAVGNENVRFENTSPTLRSCLIRGSRANGVNFLNSEARVEDCQLVGNAGFAMAMRIDSFARLKNNTAVGNGQNAIAIYDSWPGRSGTWVKDNLPYTLVNYVGINAGQTLTVEPGVIVQFQNSDTHLIVDGSLRAIGTVDRPIVFTSDEAVKSPGQWGALIFRASNLETNTLLDNCVVEYGGNAAVGNENVRFENTSPTITHCTIRGSRANGMAFLNSEARVENCQFADNAGFAMAMRIDAFARLKNNSAIGNGRNAIAIYDSWPGRSGTWVKDNPPYTLVNYVGINAGQTLTLEPGVIVQFQNPDTHLIVEGSLRAAGTVDRPIVFTSDEAMKSPGQWGAIIFRASNLETNTLMENCVVEYGGNPAVGNENVRFESASPTLRSCVIRGSQAYGVNFLRADPRVENCQLVGNAGYAMAMRVDSFARLKNNTAVGNGQNAIAIYDSWPGRSGTWVKDNLPYTLLNYVGINTDATLTIEPGVIVQFQNPSLSLLVDGTLIAEGTAALPIRFTSAELVKQPGQWQQIAFRNASGDATSILKHCLIEYGGQGAEGCLTFSSASPRVMNTTVRQSISDGIFAAGAAPRISNSRLLNNGRDGVRAVNGAAPIIANSVIAGNRGMGVNNFDSTKFLAAQKNFWGHPSGPYDNSNADGHNQLNPTGQGDKVSEYVDWSQFLGTDPTSALALPEMAVAPATLAFGKVAPSASVDLSLTISNMGNASLTVSTATSDNSQFQVLTALPISLAGGAAQALRVRFTPTLAGSHLATLTIGSDDQARSSIRVLLEGDSGPDAGLRGDFFQFQRSLGVMPNMIGVQPDYRGVFSRVTFPSTSEAFTTSDGIIPMTGPSNVFRENFSARFSGSLNVVSNGNYLFTVASDDGAMLKVNGQMVLDLNAPGAYRTVLGVMALPAGSFPIELDYFQQGGAAGLDFTVSGPGPTSLTSNTTPTALELRVADGFAATTFAEGIGFPMGLAYSGGGSFGDSLLVGDGASSGGFGSVLVFDAQAVPRQLTDALTAPTALAVDGGGGFGGDLFVVDDFYYGRDLPSPGNRDMGSDRLKRIKPDGAGSDFASFPGANALAWGQGAMGSDLVVADGYAQKLYRVNAAGTASEWVTGRPFQGLAMSAGGAFGNALYFGDYSGNSIVAVNGNGTMTLLATNIPSPISLALDPAGRFGGDLFVASFVPDVAGGNVSTQPSSLIYRVQANGLATVFASGLRFRSGASGDLAFGFNGDLFVLEDGRERVLRFSPAGLTAPTLSVTRVGKNLTLSWPTTAVNWALESTDSLLPPIHWTAVTTPPVVVGDRYSVTTATISRTQFYRLRR